MRVLVQNEQTWTRLQKLHLTLSYGDSRVLEVGRDPEFAGVLLTGGKASRSKFRWQTMGILAAWSMFFFINYHVYPPRSEFNSKHRQEIPTVP